MALEIERKYLEVDFDSLRRRLRQCGAQGGHVHLERNRIYDLPDGSLRAGHHLLRLRSQEWPDHAQNVLTLKLPPVSAPDAAFKVREERETPVADAAQMHSILEGLGYVVRACYEKIRETWTLEHTSIDMDIVPFARVVELEGPEEEILRLEALLGLDDVPVSTQSYHYLHQEWRQRNNLPPDLSFVFTPEELARWRRDLGLPIVEDSPHGR